MKKLLIFFFSIIIAALILTCLAAGFVVGMIGIAKFLGLQQALGMNTQTTDNYDSVSGVLPMVVTALGFSSLIVTAWHHLNCHETGCWKIGRFPIGDGKWKSCKAHHPDPDVKNGLTSDHLLAAHLKEN